MNKDEYNTNIRKTQLNNALYTEVEVKEIELFKRMYTFLILCINMSVMMDNV